MAPHAMELNELLGLFLLHVISFAGLLNGYLHRGYHPLLLIYALPVGLLWSLFVAADIKFRMQKPTRQELSGFDRAVIIWFGSVSIAVIYPAVLFGGAIFILWYLLF